MTVPSVNLMPPCGAELRRDGGVVAVCDRRYDHGSIPLIPINFHKQSGGPCWPAKEARC